MDVQTLVPSFIILTWSLIGQEMMSRHSDLQYSEDISKFMANFFKQIVEKRDQKLILGDNFINKISDDFYVLPLCFYKKNFEWTIKNSQKLRKTSILVSWHFLFKKISHKFGNVLTIL